MLVLNEMKKFVPEKEGLGHMVIYAQLLLEHFKMQQKPEKDKKHLKLVYSSRAAGQT
ncbi:MAG: hypothetical protein A4E57_03666 [Syntrophorhabdaceae bacterium PtaU1.Bin034]|nr:MAG: hypothetical protein A4E57_03666 [Syntrophorhabdaceae bacterium PtaU1.Bin034]